MLQDVSLYPKNGKLVSDSGLTIDPALLPSATGELLALTEYAPSSQTSKTMTGTTLNGSALAAFDTTNLTTGNFVAPTSGNVLVEVAACFKASAPGNVNVLGLCAHGTVTPVVAPTISFQTGTTNDTDAYIFRWYVTGLTPGSTYDFDLVGAETAASTASFALVAFAPTATTPVATAGGPAIITVTAAP